MSVQAAHPGFPKSVALAIAWLMFTVVLTPMLKPIPLTETTPSQTGIEGPWDSYAQPWAQYARTPTHNQTVPAHGPDGGPGAGNVSDIVELGTLEHPIVNWQAFNTGEGSDTYGSIIGDFSQSINAAEAAVERCGAGTLFPVMISSTITDGTRESFLNIVSGNDAKIAWRVSLGNTEAIRSTPAIHDIDQDGKPEIIVVYDTQGALNIDVWSPELTCTESNWQSSGHSNELVWSYSNADVRIASPLPHFATANSGHLAITQPLIADLELDGSPELILAVVDDPENNPSVFVHAYGLTTTQPSEEEWSVNLDRGTHPSDPAWAQLDATTTSILLTTMDSNSGNMWIWKIDGATGSLDWERVAVQGTDSDTDSPRLRLPGPIITQLDGDAAPEMILTVPTDPNGRTSGTGARFIGMEITSTTEVFNFRAPNGYADAQPSAMDTDDDGIDDRLCWVTWYSESALNFNRKGMLGCTDISDENPVNEWVRDLQRGSGNDNDEIAVSPPFWLDIDGEGTPEILVGFGRRFWAFDGDTGASADINNAWSTPLTMPHRVWTAPAVADVDGDGHIDVLFGDTLVSDRGPDMAPSADNRGLSFNPAQADPGQTVLVTGQFSNVGTGEADDDVDAAILMNGVELKRERFTSSDPVAPSGEGGPQTFTAEFTAQLGVHEFELVLDVNGNITEQREDNNRATATYTVVEPYVAELAGPLDTPRISPGTSQLIDITLDATGSRTADWTLSYDDSGLPESWGFAPVVGQSLTQELIPNTPVTLTFEATVPSTALGDESGAVEFELALNSDPSENTTLILPVEVFRTRGLDLTGQTGLNASYGHGRPGTIAKAWFMVENLGNAEESTTSITWTAPSWGGSPSIHDENGGELFSITLAPGESRPLFAYLQTPSSAAYGTTTQSTLTLCMGSGEQALCESMAFTFTSQKFSFTPGHHRTLPQNNLTWMVEGTLPSGGMVQWNMAEMDMLQPNWVWATTGDWTINGTYFEAVGVPGSVVSGDLMLEVPPNAVPKRHHFFGSDANDVDALFNATLHVLQIHRANITLIEPVAVEVGAPISLNVSESHRFLLGLSNPGNGEDTFTLEATISTTDPTFQPEVAFTYYDPVKTLGPLATGIGTVDVVLSEEIPALTPFTLTFHWTSNLEDLAMDAVTVEVQAAPSHEWAVESLNGTNLTGTPSEVIVVSMNLTNLGNAMDELTLEPVLTINAEGQDESQWTAEAIQSGSTSINASSLVAFELRIPNDAWAGTIVEVALLHQTSGFTIGQTTLQVEVGAVSGWRLNLTNTDLEVDPNGENLTLTLVHTGNDYETPYFAKAGAGWNITLPVEGGVVEPYGTTTFVVHVQPPENALAGEVGVLRIRITGNDTSGMVVEEVPVRVGANPSILVDHRGAWKVNEMGGYPAAWIENLGNDIAIMTVDVAGLPEGWSTQQGSQVILAPGAISGIPLDLTPASDWSFQRFLVTINVNHPLLGTVAHSIEVEYSPLSFSQPPVVDAYIGTQQSLLTYSDGVVSSITSSLDLEVKDAELQFAQPATTGEHIISFASENSSGNLSVYLVGQAYPDATISCDFLTNAFATLGQVPMTGVLGTCDFEASSDAPLRAVITLITSNGERVPLDNDMWTIASGQQETVNITVTEWDPAPGVYALDLAGFDQFGRNLEQQTTTVVARESGWNVGINSLSVDGEITVGIKRSGYGILESAVCELKVEADGGWEQVYIVDIVYSDFAPVVFIEAPDGIERDEKITATIGCNAPFDIDDDVSDDVLSAFYKPENPLAVSSSEWGWIVGFALLIIAGAWFGGAIRPSRSDEVSPVKQRRPASQETNDASTHVEPTKTVHTEIDDIHMEEMVEQPAEMHTQESVSQEEDPEMDLIEVIEEAPETTDENRTASGRLASLRQELGGDDDVERQGSIEDRMSKFFGNE